MPEPLFFVGLGVKALASWGVLWLAKGLPGMLLLASITSPQFARVRDLDHFRGFIRLFTALLTILILLAVWWPW